MSYRLHPTKNKTLKPGEPRWFQVEYGHGKGRLTIVKRFDNDRQAQLYDNALKRAGWPSVSTTVSPALDQILPEFLDWYCNHRRPRSLEAWLQGWRNLAPHFGRLKPNRLTPAMIDQYKSHRLAQKAGIRHNNVSKRTVVKELHNLSALISFAVERNICQPLTFKIRGFDRNQTAPKKRIIPTPEQIETMLGYCRSDVRPLYQLIYYTGARSEEARSLRVRDVDLGRGMILITGKGGRQRFMPVIPQLRPILEKQIEGKGPDEIIMPSNRTGKPYTSSIGHLDTAAKKAGIKHHITAHTLRHCFGTHAIAWGLDIRSVQMLLGHADVTTTQIYTTLAAEHLTGQMKRFAPAPEGNTVKSGITTNG